MLNTFPPDSIAPFFGFINWSFFRLFLTSSRRHLLQFRRLRQNLASVEVVAMTADQLVQSVVLVEKQDTTKIPKFVLSTFLQKLFRDVRYREAKYSNI